MPIENAELDLMRPKAGEIHDLSLSSFRFISVLFFAAALLMLAGVL